MSSLDDTNELQHVMPAGFHFARIMANVGGLPDDERRRAQDSARELIGKIPPTDDAMAELEQIADRLAQLLAANPEMVHAFPGDGYWPLRLIVSRLRDYGVPVETGRR